MLLVSMHMSAMTLQKPLSSLSDSISKSIIINPPITLTALVQPIIHSVQVVATRNNKCNYNPDLNHKLFGQLLKRFIGYMYNVVMSLDNITTTTLYM